MMGGNLMDADALRAAAVGKVNLKRAPPPGRGAAEMCPPWASMMALQIASPNPAPPSASAPR
jgi:hypothetical protein